MPPLELQNTYDKWFACSYNHGDSANICDYVREENYTEHILKKLIQWVFIKVRV